MELDFDWSPIIEGYRNGTLTESGNSSYSHAKRSLNPWEMQQVIWNMKQHTNEILMRSYSNSSSSSNFEERKATLGNEILVVAYGYTETRKTEERLLRPYQFFQDQRKGSILVHDPACCPTIQEIANNLKDIAAHNKIYLTHVDSAPNQIGHVLNVVVNENPKDRSKDSIVYIFTVYRTNKTVKQVLDYYLERHYEDRINEYPMDDPYKQLDASDRKAADAWWKKDRFATVDLTNPDVIKRLESVFSKIIQLSNSYNHDDEYDQATGLYYANKFVFYHLALVDCARYQDCRPLHIQNDLSGKKIFFFEL